MSHGPRPEGVTETDEFYQGPNGENVPVKIFNSRNPSRHTLIIYPGASPMAEAHPALRAVGEAMAGADFQVFIPRIPPFKDISLSEEGIEWIVHFYEWLLRSKSLSGDKITMSGISFSGALGLKASLDKRVQARPPRSIFVYSTYYSMETYLRFLATGEMRANGEKRRVQPHEWGLVVLFYNYLRRVDVGYNTSNVQRILQLCVQDLMDDVEEHTKRISGKERELVDGILHARASQEIVRITNLFWEQFKSELESLSPKTWCDKIVTRVFIMHGAEDSMTPFTESIRLADALNNSSLLITHAYEHGELSSKLGFISRLGESVRVILYFFRFIRYSEG
ncbi:MAG: hypothetical protein V3U24_03555 [Candidatus Neomarinimicrobiota bacterium]